MMVKNKLTYWNVFDTQTWRLEYSKIIITETAQCFYFDDEDLNVLWEVRFARGLVLWEIMIEAPGLERFTMCYRDSDEPFTRGFYQVENSTLLDSLLPCTASLSGFSNSLKHVIYANGDASIDFVFYEDPMIKKVTPYGI